MRTTWISLSCPNCRQITGAMIPPPRETSGPIVTIERCLFCRSQIAVECGYVRGEFVPVAVFHPLTKKKGDWAPILDPHRDRERIN